MNMQNTRGLIAHEGVGPYCAVNKEHTFFYRYGGRISVETVAMQQDNGALRENITLRAHRCIRPLIFPGSHSKPPLVI